MKRVESPKTHVHFIYFDYVAQIVRKSHIFNSKNYNIKQKLQ